MDADDAPYPPPPAPPEVLVDVAPAVGAPLRVPVPLPVPHAPPRAYGGGDEDFVGEDDGEGPLPAPLPEVPAVLEPLFDDIRVQTAEYAARQLETLARGLRLAPASGQRLCLLGQRLTSAVSELLGEIGNENAPFDAPYGGGGIIMGAANRPQRRPLPRAQYGNNHQLIAEAPAPVASPLDAARAALVKAERIGALTTALLQAKTLGDPALVAFLEAEIAASIPAHEIPVSPPPNPKEPECPVP